MKEGVTLISSGKECVILDGCGRLCQPWKTGRSVLYWMVVGDCASLGRREGVCYTGWLWETVPAMEDGKECVILDGCGRLCQPSKTGRSVLYWMVVGDCASHRRREGVCYTGWLWETVPALEDGKECVILDGCGRLCQPWKTGRSVLYWMVVGDCASHGRREGVCYTGWLWETVPAMEDGKECVILDGCVGLCQPWKTGRSVLYWMVVGDCASHGRREGVCYTGWLWETVPAMEDGKECVILDGCGRLCQPLKTGRSVLYWMVVGDCASHGRREGVCYTGWLWETVPAMEDGKECVILDGCGRLCQPWKTGRSVLYWMVVLDCASLGRREGVCYTGWLWETVPAMEDGKECVILDGCGRLCQPWKTGRSVLYWMVVGDCASLGRREGVCYTGWLWETVPAMEDGKECVILDGCGRLCQPWKTGRSVLYWMVVGDCASHGRHACICIEGGWDMWSERVWLVDSLSLSIYIYMTLSCRGEWFQPCVE